MHITFFPEDVDYLLVMKGSQIIDVSLQPKNKTTGHITPIVGIEGGVMFDYDHLNSTLFWVQGVKEDEDSESNAGNVSCVGIFTNN